MNAEKDTAAWSEHLRKLLDRANRVLRQGDRREASRDLAMAAEQLFLQAKKEKDIEEKQSLVHRATEVLRASVRLYDENSRDYTVPKTAPQNAVKTPFRESVSDAFDGVWPENDGAGFHRNVLTSSTKRLAFSDIAGLEGVKETLSLRVIYPLRHPDKLEKYGISGGGGMLLFGPPGTGKTLLVRAVAGELGLPFYVIKSSEILSRYFGESEKQLAELFDDARKQPHGAVVFLDEVDAIGAKRTESMNEASRRVLTQLLQELDGVDGRSGKLVFFAATNEPWLLDSALLRPPRFCEKCYVPLPDEAARRVLFDIGLRGCPVVEHLPLDDLVRRTENFSGADIVNLCERAKLLPFRDSILTGRDRALTPEDFDQAMQDVRPSVSPVNLRRYENWNND